jgi:tetratricopeptide (TPR) repeat protein
MSGTDPKDLGREFACPFSAGTDLEDAVVKAWKLLKKNDLEGSLVLLSGLEKRYVRAVKLFDLLGDVHIRRGDLEEGVRYKSLYEILRGTFKIAGEESKASASDLPGALEPMRTSALVREPETGPDVYAPAVEEQPRPRSEPAGAEAGLFPVTESMAEEFVKQGHYERAAEIFDMLLERNPENGRLKQAKTNALKKSRETRVLGILKGWLGSIEQMKSDLSTEQ